MKKLVGLFAGPVAAALLCVAFVSPSYAQTTTFVSDAGSNANACTKALPCQTILHALNIAQAGGVVSCLDAGPFVETIVGPDPFTLDCPGVVYTNGGGTIQLTGDSSQVVTFRNVIFDGGAGNALVAIAVITGNPTVVLKNCTFKNFKTNPGRFAIEFTPNALGAQLFITDSVFLNNGVANGGGGISIQPSPGGSAKVVIERTQIENNTYGIVANGTGGPALVEIKDSTIANSAANGIWAYTGGSTSSIVVNRTSSDHNGGSGIIATGAGAYVSLNGSTVAWNGTGLSTVSGGLILSYKNNIVGGNLNPGVSPIGVTQQ